MANVEGDDSPSWYERLKLFLAILSFFSLLCFIVLMIIKIDAEMRETTPPFALEWISVFIPLAATIGLSFLWLLLNYCSKAPSTRGIPAPGTGGQFWFNLLSQTLVKKVSCTSIDSLNESYMFAAILSSIVFVLLAVLAGMATRHSCAHCDAPYSMLGYGFASLYSLRFLLLVYNTLKGYEHYCNMSEEVRAYQENMDQTRLFDFSVEALFKTKSSTYMDIIDGFLWCANTAFLALALTWLSSNKCESTCSGTFHVYYMLLLGITVAELIGVMARFGFSYHRRISYIDVLESLVSKIHEHQEKSELMPK